MTGLGLPSEMAGAIKSGASKSFIWNPIDLGYAAAYLADDLVKGTASKTKASMGKLGKVQLDADGSGAMAEPFVYDASNIDKFSKSLTRSPHRFREKTEKVIMMASTPLLSLKGITKVFPGVHALETTARSLARQSDRLNR